MAFNIACIYGIIQSNIHGDEIVDLVKRATQTDEAYLRQVLGLKPSETINEGDLDKLFGDGFHIYKLYIRLAELSPAISLAICNGLINPVAVLSTKLEKWDYKYQELNQQIWRIWFGKFANTIVFIIV